MDVFEPDGRLLTELETPPHFTVFQSERTEFSAAAPTNSMQSASSCIRYVGREAGSFEAPGRLYLSRPAPCCPGGRPGESPITSTGE